MPQFFISETKFLQNLIKINNKETYNHLTRSLRIRVGEEIKFIDENETVYVTEISEIKSHEIIAKIKESYPSFRKLNFDLTLAQGILHSDAQNMLIQKATELGVKTIIPIITDNCAVKKEIAQNKIEKWQKIAFEAFKQCERANIPDILPISDLNSLNYQKYDKVIVCSEKERVKTLKDCNIKNAKKILLIVGVEGGFSEREFDFFEEKNFDIITLGNLILKAETAVIAAISNVVYEKENG